MNVSVVRGPHGGVLWVDAEEDGQRVSLGGYCRYWTTVDRVGGFGCSDHPAGPVSYRWAGVRFVREAEPPPAGVAVEVGEWLPDDEWRRLRYG